MNRLEFDIKAARNLQNLEKDPSQIIVLNAVRKALKQIEKDPKHNSLNSQRFYELDEEFREKVFESYAQNNTPGAYRIFWHYGPGRKVITILYITPHP